jgi:hypothetical protein
MRGGTPRVLCRPLMHGQYCSSSLLVQGTRTTGAGREPAGRVLSVNLNQCPQVTGIPATPSPLPARAQLQDAQSAVPTPRRRKCHVVGAARSTRDHRVSWQCAPGGLPLSSRGPEHGVDRRKATEVRSESGSGGTNASDPRRTRCSERWGKPRAGRASSGVRPPCRGRWWIRW